MSCWLGVAVVIVVVVVFGDVAGARGAVVLVSCCGG